ncbi:MAG: VWA domain-containing protein [bacterium]
MTLAVETTWILLPAAVLLLAGVVAVVPPRSPYRTLSAVLRLASLVLLAVALAGPRVQGTDPGIHTVYLLDASGSVYQEESRRAAGFVVASTQGLAAPDTAAVIAFAEDSHLLVPRDSRPTRIAAALGGYPGRDGSLPPRGATNLAGAIDHALSALPPSGDRRVVVISDGVETVGNARAATAAARSRGVRVSAVYTGDASRPEVRLAEVRVPERVDPGEVFEVTVVTESTGPAEATLALFRDDESLGSDEVTLTRGRNVFRYRDRTSTPGIRTYRAVVESSADTLNRNNQATGAVHAGRESRILYLREENVRRPFEEALTAQGLRVVGLRPADLSATLTELSAYDTVVIDNVPASRFSLSRMNELERYVRRTGGGVVMLGGPSSFGAGGYFQTPVEQLLPVSMDVTSTVRVPTLAMLFLVDKSGSMEVSPGTGVPKLEIVKEAVLSSIEIMNPYHLVGLISFDAAAERTIPITRVAERERIATDVARLRSGGGTVLATALEEAKYALQEVEASTKHVIILSDGLTRDADFRRLARELADQGITVSTVSIGTDANKRIMEMIAGEGGGRYYHTDDTSRVPRIFTQETSIVARNVIVEEAFFPTGRAEHALLSGIPVNELPALDGFVMTYPKNSARQLMDASQGHPLLATWQYGLGRAVAFTSGVDGRWGRSWAEWELLPRFAGQIVDWVQRPAYTGEVSARVTREGSTGRVAVDVTEGRARYVNDAVMTAALSRPDGTDQNVQLNQAGPGRYVGEVELAEAGVHVLSVAGSPREAAAPRGETSAPRIGPSVLPVTVPYPAEYAALRGAPSFLQGVATLGDGVLVSLSERGFPHRDLPRVRTSDAEPRPIWPLLVVAAAVLFVVEIVVRVVRNHEPPAQSRARRRVSRRASRRAFHGASHGDSHLASQRASTE